VEREEYGKFFYRFPHGESGADVCDRVCSFLEAFQREKLSFPMNTNVVILTHGLTIRMFVKRWFHLSVETFHEMTSPAPGRPIHLLRRDARTGSFRLTDECISQLSLPTSLNRENGYEFRNKQLLGSVSTGAPFL
jgi:broad specificity phosphatase PhoE